MRVFNVYVGGKLACVAMTEKEELTISRFIEDIINNPNEHEVAILEDYKNGACVEIEEN